MILQFATVALQILTNKRSKNHHGLAVLHIEKISRYKTWFMIRIPAEF